MSNTTEFLSHPFFFALGHAVSPDSILKWAAIFGAEEAWGALPFPDEIPERLLNELRRLV